MSNSISARSKIVSVALIAALASAGVLGFAAPAAAKTTTVSTASQLKSALTAAAPGDIITLAAGTYTGKFVSAKNGTAAAPITLTGPRGAVITTGSIGSGYALNVTGDHWNLSGFSVATAKKGIVLDGSTGSRLDRLDVGSVGEEAVHVRANSADVVIANSSIHHTGLTAPGYGGRPPPPTAPTASSSRTTPSGRRQPKASTSKRARPEDASPATASPTRDSPARTSPTRG
jgi:hypothetical protein